MVPYAQQLPEQTYSITEKHTAASCSLTAAHQMLQVLGKGSGLFPAAVVSMSCPTEGHTTTSLLIKRWTIVPYFSSFMADEKKIRKQKKLGGNY